jgi:hypothetical protein
MSKAVIEQSQLTDELELEVGDGVVVLRAIRSVRRIWQGDVANCRAASVDDLADWDAVSSDFDGVWK